MRPPRRRAASAGLSAEAADAARREADECGAAPGAGSRPDRAREAESSREEVAAAAATLESQKQQLETRVGRARRSRPSPQERDDLAGQLDNALSSVAQITKTARGVVVNLPDILFDTNKATLKQNAQVAMGSSPESCRSSRTSTCASRATPTRPGPTRSTTVCRGSGPSTVVDVPPEPGRRGLRG